MKIHIRLFKTINHKIKFLMNMTSVSALGFIQYNVYILHEIFINKTSYTKFIKKEVFEAKNIIESHIIEKYIETIKNKFNIDKNKIIDIENFSNEEQKIIMIMAEIHNKYETEIKENSKYKKSYAMLEIKDKFKNRSIELMAQAIMKKFIKKEVIETKKPIETKPTINYPTSVSSPPRKLSWADMVDEEEAEAVEITNF